MKTHYLQVKERIKIKNICEKRKKKYSNNTSEGAT